MSEIDYDNLGLEDIEVLVEKGETDLVFTKSRGMALVDRIRELEAELDRVVEGLRKMQRRYERCIEKGMIYDADSALMEISGFVNELLEDLDPTDET